VAIVSIKEDETSVETVVEEFMVEKVEETTTVEAKNAIL